MSEPLRVQVTGASTHVDQISAPYPGDMDATIPGQTHYEVEIRAVIRSPADYDRWRALVGTTLEVTR